MQLALNVELTDGQYQELMTKSLDSILDKPQVEEALSKAIVSKAEEYLDKSPHILQSYLSPTGYGQEYSQKNLVKKLLSNATEEFQQIISKATTKYMQEMLTKVDLDKLMICILHEVMLQGTADAVKGSIQAELDSLWSNVFSTNDNIQKLAYQING